MSCPDCEKVIQTAFDMLRQEQDTWRQVAHLCAEPEMMDRDELEWRLLNVRAIAANLYYILEDTLK